MSEDSLEYGPDTFEIFTDKTLKNLVATDFKKIATLIDTSRPNFYNFKIPQWQIEKEELKNFI